MAHIFFKNKPDNLFLRASSRQSIAKQPTLMRRMRQFLQLREAFPQNTMTGYKKEQSINMKSKQCRSVMPCAVVTRPRAGQKEACGVPLAADAGLARRFRSRLVRMSSRDSCHGRGRSLAGQEGACFDLDFDFDFDVEFFVLCFLYSLGVR